MTIPMIPTDMDSTLVADANALSLEQLAHTLNQDENWVVTLVDCDILPIGTPDRTQWRFDGMQISRARRAYRLQRDFEASLPAVALMMDLLDELNVLRRQMHSPVRHFEVVDIGEIS